MSKLERLLKRVTKRTPHENEAEASSLERQFAQNIDSSMNNLGQGTISMVHFNYVEFGRRIVDGKSEYFFQETVLKDEDGFPVSPYLDIFETEKGRLKHKIKMLSGNKSEVVLGAKHEDIDKILGKLYKIANIFGKN